MHYEWCPDKHAGTLKHYQHGPNTPPPSACCNLNGYSMTNPSWKTKDIPAQSTVVEGNQNVWRHLTHTFCPIARTFSQTDHLRRIQFVDKKGYSHGVATYTHTHTQYSRISMWHSSKKHNILKETKSSLTIYTHSVM